MVYGTVQCMLSKLYGPPTIVWPVYDANWWVCLFGQTVGIPVGLYTFILTNAYLHCYIDQFVYVILDQPVGTYSFILTSGFIYFYTDYQVYVQYVVQYSVCRVSHRACVQLSPLAGLRDHLVGLLVWPDTP